MAQYLLTCPSPRMVARPKLDASGKHVLDAEGKIVVEVDQIVSPLTGYDLALQSVTQGPKLFDVWALRKRIKEVTVPDRPFDSAKYMVLDDSEKEILTTGFKTLDWTFGGKHMFWVEWEQLFDSVNGIKLFDEKAPPADYVKWKHEFEAAKAVREAAKLEAERKALAEREAAEAKRNTGIARLAGTRLAEALAAKIAEGKLGAAATAEDLPAGLVDAIKTQAVTDYDANPGMFDAPPEPGVTEAQAEPVDVTALPAADSVESTSAAPENTQSADLAEAKA